MWLILFAMFSRSPLSCPDIVIPPAGAQIRTQRETRQYQEFVLQREQSEGYGVA